MVIKSNKNLYDGYTRKIYFGKFSVSKIFTVLRYFTSNLILLNGTYPLDVILLDVLQRKIVMAIAIVSNLNWKYLQI